MAEGILTISQAGMIRFAKRETTPTNWENTLVCEEVNPDGKHYGYAQRFIIGEILKVYFKSGYGTHSAQLKDELGANVGAAITPTLETNYPAASPPIAYYSISLDTAAWSASKSYYLVLVGTDVTFDTVTFQSEPIIVKATLPNHVRFQWTNYSTAFELDYSNLNITHFIYVPGRVFGYKPEGDIEVYSNQGILTKIHEVVERVRTLECEPIPMYLCEKINIALAHDVVSLNGKEFVKKALPTTPRFSKTNMHTLTCELTQSYANGINSDDDGFDYISAGGDSWETVKNFPLDGVTGAQSIDVGAYRDDFRINDIVVTLLSGTGGTIKAGLSVGGEDILAETDLSGFVIGNPQSLYCGAAFGAGQDTVYITLTGVSYDIDLTLLRYKV